MDKTAIQEIQANAAALQLGSRVKDTEVPVAALPKDFAIHSLEQYQAFRARFRGQLSTQHVVSFVSYHKQAGAAAPVFIDPSCMKAVAIFDLGDVDAPMHAEHRATLEMEKTAPYRAFVAFTQKTGHAQRDMAEFVEDWRQYITAFDDEDAEIPVKNLIATIRRLTIESARKVDSTEGNWSSSKSALEKIEAKSEAGAMPKALVFTCQPYKDLPDQEFHFRIGLRASGDSLAFSVFRIQAESDEEKTAEAFVSLLSGQLQDGTTLYQGSFSI